MKKLTTNGTRFRDFCALLDLLEIVKRDYNTICLEEHY